FSVFFLNEKLLLHFEVSEILVQILSFELLNSFYSAFYQRYKIIILVITFLDLRNFRACCQRFAAKRRGDFQSTFLSARDKDSHEERTWRKPPTAPFFLGAVVARYLYSYLFRQTFSPFRKSSSISVIWSTVTIGFSIKIWSSSVTNPEANPSPPKLPLTCKALLFSSSNCTM